MGKNKRLLAALVGEDFAGMRAQLFGLSGRLGWKGQFYPVQRNFSRLSLFLLRHLPLPLTLLFLKKKLPVLPKETAMIISVGGVGGWVGALLAHAYHLPIIQIQNPRASFFRYHFIITCEHDGVAGKNILSLPTALHGITSEILENEKNKWQVLLNPMQKAPFLGVLLGGNNGRYKFGAAEAQKLAEEIRGFLEKNNGQAFILRSRRTDEKILEILKAQLQNLPVSFWEGKTENPYKGVLACADILCVTGDSVSMLSEAAATTAALGVFPLKGQSKKLEKFHKLLFSTGRAQAFTSDMKPNIFQPLDAGEKAVREVKKRFRL
ncbi:hypothetical protein FAI41_00915 [Acetobacteraceae bacterium]|nr:hypothetical protein FAI41_00915 [Acetobacteraceae bacterium]